jgi:hypothetical protein
MRILIILALLFSFSVNAQLPHKQLTNNIDLHFCEFQYCFSDDSHYLEITDILENSDTTLYFNYVRDTAEPSFYRLLVLALMQKYYKEATYRNLDFSFIKKLYLQMFAEPYNLSSFVCFYENQPITFIGQGFIELGEAIIPDLYNYLDRKDDLTGEHAFNFFCSINSRLGVFNGDYQDCSLFFLRTITNIQEIVDNNLTKEAEIAIFKTKIQAYCAERGIKLE